MPELGRETVNALFASVALPQMIVTVLGYAEPHSILVRKRNQGVLDTATFTTATSALQNEILYGVGFGVLDLSFDAVVAGIALVDKHNLNATDGAILFTYLRYVQLTAAAAPLLVATDRRLLRAAEAEGLRTLNPERTAAADLPALLAGT